ncbi:response regulator [Desulforhopalus sp. IMCC35007]|uniref:response regulator n=1 Tax=Desulforhopalus sp. IMCC35007 TaxID=2569543 RepID=UPI0010AEB5F0|nr:response regulator [Desulforhopalus sp. IMCC35007]TKB10848.1 response regulator [Desulforhopalus sp. IMCC35007]
MATPRLMIVEDERIIAADLEEQLVGLGYEVCANVASGEEAIVVNEKESLDLVLMDIQLDGAIDGTEAAQKIFEATHVPVVFVTAYSDKKTLNKGKLSEPYGYLIKPYRIRDLSSTIEMALNKAAADAKLRIAHLELEKALEELKTLKEIIPICSCCKKVRGKEGSWTLLEQYIREHSLADFTHGICEDCAEKLYANESWYQEMMDTTLGKKEE